MTRQLAFIVTCLMLLSATGYPQEVTHQSQTGTLTIEVTSVGDQGGQLEIGLYNHSRGFLHIENAFRRVVVDATPGTVRVTIEELPNGTYAVALYHDENGNGTLDTNFFHLPTEGTGLSNDARAHFGPPRYRDASFSVVGDTFTQIPIHY